MPSYVYECSKCSDVTEVFHSMSEDRTDCEACGEQNTLNKIPEVPIYLKSNTAGKIVKHTLKTPNNKFVKTKNK